MKETLRHFNLKRSFSGGQVVAGTKITTKGLPKARVGRASVNGEVSYMEP